MLTGREGGYIRIRAVGVCKKLRCESGGLLFTGRDGVYMRLHKLGYIGRIYGFYEGYLDVTPNHGESNGKENGQLNGIAGLIAALSKF